VSWAGVKKSGWLPPERPSFSGRPEGMYLGSRQSRRGKVSADEAKDS